LCPSSQARYMYFFFTCAEENIEKLRGKERDSYIQRNCIIYVVYRTELG
jgi:hypothetical protein